jgi:hypothetical protein
MAIASGSVILPVFDLAGGASKRNSSGRTFTFEQAAGGAAVTTYFYRVLATGVRGTTTSLGSVPVGAVIEGTSTT